MRAERDTKTRLCWGSSPKRKVNSWAAAGYTWGGICELRQVWVREAYRGKGLGETLMTEATREAKARGCAYLYLATNDFQAPGFYAKVGFEKGAEIPDKPLGHTEFVMRLRLRSDRAK